MSQWCHLPPPAHVSSHTPTHPVYPMRCIIAAQNSSYMSTSYTIESEYVSLRQ